MSTPKEFADALAGFTPDQHRQREFITALCNNVRDHVLTMVPRFPARWGGHELRALLAEKFEHEVMWNKRARAYRQYTSERHQI